MEGVSPELEKILDKIFLLERESGWYDDDGNDAITPECCQACYDFVMMVYSYLPMKCLPRVSPSPQGGISLSWRGNGMHIHTIIRSTDPEQVNYVCEGPNEFHDVENQTMPGMIENIMWKVVEV